jgi:hypothetical protein
MYFSVDNIIVLITGGEILFEERKINTGYSVEINEIN